MFDPFIKDGLNEALKKQVNGVRALTADSYDITYEEIAKRQETGINTVAGSVYKCRAKLLKFLGTKKGLF